MAHDTVHRAVLVVGKVQDQALVAMQERFAQSQGCRSARQRKQRDERAQYDGEHEPRMPTEHQAADQSRRLLRGLPADARTQQRE